MAERNTIQHRPAKSNRTAPASTFLQKIQSHAPASTFLQKIQSHAPASTFLQKIQSHAPASTFLQKIQSHAPNTTHLLGFSILFFVSISSLLILTATILGFVFFMPLIIVSSPIWLPICALLLVTTVGFLSACGFGVALAAGSTWMYRYFRDVHPPGADRVDSARIRIYDTVSHVKDYAIECGGYLQSKVKDAAPGA